MPEYLSPGVYIEETSYRGKPIEGVSTSTAGVVGRTKKGPEGRPTLITSYAQFQREFGSAYSTPEHLGEYLGHAMQGFFENGGRRVYVVRVLGDGAQAATTDTFHGSIYNLPAGTTIRGPTQILKLDSLHQITTTPTTTLRIFVRETAASPFVSRHVSTVAGYDTMRGTVTLSTGLPAGLTLTSDNCYVVIDGQPPASTAGVRATIHARSRGAGGNQLAIRFRPADRPPVRFAVHSYDRLQPELFSFTAADPGPNASSTVALPNEVMRRVQRTDTVALRGGTGADETRTVQAIGTATLAISGVSGPGSGTALELFERDGALATPVALPTLPSSVNVVAATTSLTVPHEVAAMLHTGDIVRLGGAVTFTVDSVDFADTLTLSSATAGDFSTGSIHLITTPGRLLVRSVTGLAAPNRDSDGAEPIVVHDVGSSTATTIRLVDTIHNVVWVADPGIAEWRSFELLAVATHGDTRLALRSVAGFYSGAIVEIDTGSRRSYDVVSSIDAASRTIELVAGLNLGGAGQTIELATNPDDRRAYVRILELDVDVLEGGVTAESFTGLSWNRDPSADSFARYWVARINDEDIGSRLIEITTAPTSATADPVGRPATADGFPLALENGDDGGDPEAHHFMGTDGGAGKRTGIEALKERDDISIVAAPGIVDEGVQASLITHAELMRYRVAVLDGYKNQPDPTELQAHRNNYDSKYAAYYAPWLTVLDRSSGRRLVVPPSGHVMGIYARVDNTRGVHKAPANEIVRSVIDVELPFTTGEQDVLNPVGVNLIREFPGRGIRVWGARTISSDSEWKYLNVRRLFNFLEHSIDRGTQWVVFEPNNQALWDRVRETIESFLFGIWKSGALFGGTPEEAYFVRIDHSTMTQDDIDNGRLVAQIGIAPTMPAEFVIFRIGQFTASAKG